MYARPSQEEAVNAAQPFDRRTFLADLGRGAFALAVVGIAGCMPDAAGSAGPGASPRPSGSPGASRPPAPQDSGAPPPSDGNGAGAVAWERVNLGFVSAYIIVRGGEAAIVDSGVSGSEAAIEAALTGVGVPWESVGHLILTHHHGDHAGSAAAIMERATAVTAYAGAEDIAAISVPRPLVPVADGETVFGLRVVATPGHTAGSISVLDRAGGILVVGDAMGTSGGAPTLPGERFTVDMDEAKRSIVKLGELTFETLLVGHGEPIEAGAAALVAELGAAG